MDENQFNTSGDIDQPIDNNAEQPTNNTNNTNNTNDTLSDNSTETPQEVIIETAEVTTVEPVTTTKSADSSEPVMGTTESTDSTNPASTTKSAKDRTGLILGIIITIVLLCGCGALAAFAIIKNQPQNIALESFNNLLNAKQVEVTGSFKFNPGDQLKEYIGPINVQIDSHNADSNQYSNTSLSVEYPEFDDPIKLDIGEVMMKDGVFYLKASGLQKIYEDIVEDKLTEYLESQIKSQYQYSLYDACDYSAGAESYFECLDQELDTTDPAVLATIQAKIAIIQDHLENIVQDVDDQWFEFSIDDILDSELIEEYIDTRTKNSVTKAHECFTTMTNNFSSYTPEFSDLYSKNQFMVLNPAQDSFYKITFAPNQLASYLSGIPKTRLVNDYASCNGITLTDNSFGEITASDIEKSLEYLPDIYARFDGFLDHHLTDLKISRDYDYFNIESNLSFTYPNNLVISPPSNSTPVMDAVEDIMTEINQMTNELNY